MKGKKKVGGLDRDRTGDALLAKIGRTENQQVTTIGEILLLSDTSAAET